MMAFETLPKIAIFLFLQFYFLLNPIAVAQKEIKTGIKSKFVGGNPIVCNALSSEIKQRANKLNERRMNLYLWEASKKGCFAIAVNLIDRGSSLNARDRFGNTSLHHASRMGHNRLVKFFLERGADIERPNLAGSTPLIQAVTSNRRRTTKILLDAGADLDIINKNGVTPLASAAFNGNDRILMLLLKNGANPSKSDGTGKGPIVYAAARGYFTIVQKLISAGVKVNHKYANELTALMWASGHSNDVPEADGIRTVKLIIEQGAELDLKDNRGRTAMMIAAERGHAEIVKVLRNSGASLNLRDNKSQSALDLAANDEVISALKK